MAFYERGENPGRPRQVVAIVVEIKRNRSESFSIIGNEALRRSDLSARAKGIFAYIMTLPDDWILYKEELFKHFTEGRDALNKAFRELVDAGYIVVEQKKEKGRFSNNVYQVFDTVNGFSVNGYPSTVSPTTEKPQLLITEEPNTDKQNIYIGEFNRFWDVYPKKASKKKAREKFLSLAKKGKLPDIDRHVDIIESWKKTEKWVGGFIPHPTTWLNGELWDDELEGGRKLNESLVSATRPAEDHIAKLSEEDIEANRIMFEEKGAASLFQHMEKQWKKGVKANG